MQVPPIQPPHTAYVSFSAEIIPHTAESLIAACANLVNQGVQEIQLLVSTPGGAVMNGLNVYHVLRGLPVHIVTHNVGNVDSIGNAVFLAGDERYACPQATFMFHGVGFDSQGQRLEEPLLRQCLAGVLAEQKRIGEVIVDRTNLTVKEANALFRKTQTKDAAYAVGAGIIHEVRDVQIPAGAPVVQLVFQR